MERSKQAHKGDSTVDLTDAQSLGEGLLGLLQVSSGDEEAAAQGGESKQVSNRANRLSNQRAHRQHGSTKVPHEQEEEISAFSTKYSHILGKPGLRSYKQLVAIFRSYFATVKRVNMPHVPPLSLAHAAQGVGGSTLHSWALVRDILLEETAVSHSDRWVYWF